MNAENNALRRHAGEEEWFLEETIDRFERAWQHGTPPSLRDFFSEHHILNHQFRVEFALVDFEYRLRTSEPVALASYLVEVPEILTDVDAIRSLVAIETRWKRGLLPTQAKRPGNSLLDDQWFASDIKADSNGIGPALRSSESSNLTIPQHCGGDSDATAIFDRSAPRGVTAEQFARSFSIRNDASLFAQAIGRFRLLDMLGQGSFGTVFRAIDLALGRLVAVKIPRRGYFNCDDDRDRFLREARSTARLAHPDIVPVYEVGTDGDMPFIVSGLVEGRTLAELLLIGRPGFEEATTMCATLAGALHYAHERGVVHRDIKPSNIMVDWQRRPFLMDFGLAKPDGGEASLTMEGQVLGTPAYMSPEQAQGQIARVDARSDVYSLGVVFYEMLTGERPFRGNVRMLIEQVVNDVPRSPASLNDHVPRDLTTICLKCLQKSPASRYQTAQELAADLRRFLRHEAILARRVSAFEHGWRWVRRRPRIAALVGTIFALTVTLAVVSTVAAFRIELARERADRNAATATKRLDELYVANGVSAVASDHAARALPSFAESLKLRLGDSDLEAVGRNRLITNLRAMPALESLQNNRNTIMHVVPSANKAFIVVSGGDGTATLYDSSSDQLTRRHAWKFAAMVAQSVISPNGDRLATVSNDGRVSLWRVGAINEDPIVLKHPGIPTTAIFSPDSTWIATACRDGCVRVWDVDTAKHSTIVIKHRGPVNHLAIGARGELLASASVDGTSCLYSVADRSIRVTLKHDGPVNQVGFAEDGNTFVTVSDDKTARVWDLSTSQQQFVLHHDASVCRLALASSKNLLATGCVDGAVRVWNVSTGSSLVFWRHEDQILDLSFSKDDALVVSTSNDKTARVWDIATGAPVTPLLVHGGGVPTACFFKDQRRLITGCFDGTLRSWYLRDPFEAEVDVRAVAPLTVVHLSPDGRWLVAIGANGQLCLHDLVSKTAVVTLSEERAVRKAAFASQGVIATAGTDGTLHVWDLKSRRRTALDSVTSKPIACLCFSGDGRLLVGSLDGTVQVWNELQGPPSFVVDHGERLAAAGFSPDGTRICSMSEQGSRIRDSTDGKILQESPAHSHRALGSLFTSSGNSLIGMHNDREVTIWDIRSGKAMSLPHRGAVVNVSENLNSTRLGSASEDKVGRVWNTQAGILVGRELSHGRDVNQCVLSYDARLVATASDDHTARVWDATTGEPVSPPLRHDDRVIFVAFRANGTELVSASADGIVRQWKLDSPSIPTGQLARLSRLISAYEVDDTGAPVPVDAAVLERDWKELHKLILKDAAPLKIPQ